MPVLNQVVAAAIQEIEMIFSCGNHNEQRDQNEHQKSSEVVVYDNQKPGEFIPVVFSFSSEVSIEGFAKAQPESVDDQRDW